MAGNGFSAVPFLSFPGKLNALNSGVWGSAQSFSPSLEVSLLHHLTRHGLIQYLRIGKYKDEQIVGIDKKGIGCAEQYLINRYLAYSQVIYHKYTSILGCMVQSITKWMISSGASGYIFSDIIDMVKNHEKNQRFQSFTDNYFLSFISDINQPKDGCPNDIYNFVKYINGFRALSMKEEFSCSRAHREDLLNDIEQSDLWKYISALRRDEINEVLQFRVLSLTKQKPITQFSDDLKRAISTNEVESDIEERFYIDRLQEGLAIIEDGHEPYLLVDSPRSMLRDIYGLQFCVLRSYNI